jgi:hypothetical protein
MRILMLGCVVRMPVAGIHTSFVSFAENIGLSCCTVPDDGLPWRPTRQETRAGRAHFTSGPIPTDLVERAARTSFAPVTA